MILNFVNWNVDPEIVGFWGLSIRYYGVLFAASFFFGYIIIQKIFKKEGLKVELLDKLTVYMAVGTVLGARLGHCLFYEPAYYLANPIKILMIWQGGLASHGAAIGILISLWYFSKKNKKSYLWTLDRIVIVVALAGFFIRSGNLMNSEIYGIETQNKSGFVFTGSFSQKFSDTDFIKKIRFIKDKDDKLIQERFIPLTMNITFDKKIKDKAQIKNIITYDINSKLSRNLQNKKENLFYPPNTEFTYKLEKKDQCFVASLSVLGLPKHPTQIYEALLYLFIFLLLYFIYNRKRTYVKQGLIFSLFLILMFTVRFFIEFIKEDQVGFEKGMSLNMGQWLSIPFILIGFFLLYRSLKLQPTKE